MAFHWPHAGVLALALVSLGAPSAALAQEPRPNPPKPHADAVPAAYGERAQAIWNQALALESAEQLDRAAQEFEQLTRLHPTVSAAYWRAARSHWRIADVALEAPRDERLARFERARELAKRGAEIDPSCAECLLWQFGSLGRLSILRGVLWGARHGSEMADLLDRGIALHPATPADVELGTLGNLHYASAVFYRTAPEWFWLEWIIGVRGDLERALGDVRQALAQNPERIDYQIELGTILLCLGERRGETARTQEGIEALKRALELPPVLESDPIDQRYARLLIERPAQACTWSRDGFVDMDALTPANLGGDD